MEFSIDGAFERLLRFPFLEPFRFKRHESRQRSVRKHHIEFANVATRLTIFQRQFAAGVVADHSAEAPAETETIPEIVEPFIGFVMFMLGGVTSLEEIQLNS